MSVNKTKYNNNDVSGFHGFTPFIVIISIRIKKK